MNLNPETFQETTSSQVSSSLLEKCKSYRLLFFLILLACTLSGISLGQKSLWLDECYSIIRSSPPWEELAKTVAQNDSHPPLYYSVLKIWRSFAPANFLTNEGSLRFPSVIFFLVTIFMLYQTLSLLCPRKAFFGTFLAATSSFALQYARDARHYSLALCLAAGLTYCLVGMVQARSHRYSRGYFLFTLLSLYTYYYLGFLCLVYGVGICLWARKKQDLRTLFKEWFMGQALALLLFLPWALLALPSKFALFSQQGASLETRGEISLGKIFQALGDLALGEKSAQQTGWTILLCFWLFGQSVWLAGRFKKERVWVGLTWGVLGAVFAILLIFPFKGHIFQAKHVIFLLPAIWILLAFLIDTRFPCTIFLFLFLVGSNIYSFCFYYPQEKQAWEKASLYLYENIPSARDIRRADVVCLNPLYLRAPFLYYYQKHALLDAQAGKPRHKNFLFRYTYDSRGGYIPFNYPPDSLYLQRTDLRATQEKGFWLVEIENCSVAPPEPRMHSWCLDIYKRQSEKRFPGLLGDIVITYYVPKE